MDPLMVAALNTPNPNQYLAQQYTCPQDNTRVATNYVTPSFQGNTPAPVATSTAEAPKSSGMGTTGAILTTVGVIGAGAAIIGAYKNRNGKGIVEGFKNLWKSLTGSGSKAAGEAVAAATKGGKEVSTQFQVQVGRGGRLICTVPGKTTTLTGSAAENYARTHGIDISKLKVFNKESSQVTGGTFMIEGNTVTFQNGKVKKIVNPHGTDITKDPHLASDFLDRIDTRIVEIESRTNNAWGKVTNTAAGKEGLIDVQYRTTRGDDIVTTTFTLPTSTRSAQFKVDKLTTLKRCDINDDVVQAYFYDNPAVKDLFNVKTIKSGKVPEGLSFSFDHNMSYRGKNYLCHFTDNGQTLRGITLDGKFYDSTTDTFKAFISKNEESLKTTVEGLTKDGKLPKNARLYAT